MIWRVASSLPGHDASCSRASSRRGDIHLGNYLGAMRHWVGRPARAPTPSTASSTSTPSRVPHDPGELRAKTLALATMLLAGGLDPDVCTLFVQSHVAEHTELAWLMECTARIRRAAAHDAVQGQVGSDDGRVRLRRAAHLPGADGGRHPALRHRPRSRSATTSASTSSSPATSRCASTAATARRSSCPRPRSPKVGARVMDLQDPTAQDVEVGRLAAGHRDGARPARGHRAQDQAGRHRHRQRGPLRPWRRSPGVSNLLSILAACTGESPEALAEPVLAVRPAQDGHRGRRSSRCCDRSGSATNRSRPIPER